MSETAVLWQQVMVKVASPKGEEEQRALTHANAPGLAVTMHQFGEFDVTHVKSGKKIAGPFERCKSAELVLAEMAQCLDWTQDAPGIAAQLKERGDQPVPFDGATISGGGQTRPQTIAEFMRNTRDWFACDNFPWESPDEDPGARAMEILNGPGGSSTPQGAT